MRDLKDTWARTTAHLRRASTLVEGRGDLALFDEYLDHNELELATDVLAEVGDDLGDLEPPFWDALKSAYEDMGLTAKATRCRFRIYEAKHGFVEAELTLTPTEAGGKKQSISTDYRPDWNIGNVTENGELEINGAPVTLENSQPMSPGDTGLVRLHPLSQVAWTRVRPGMKIFMHEGARVVGEATVLRVTLKAARETAE
jgi:hypothetical protein